MLKCPYCKNVNSFILIGDFYKYCTRCKKVFPTYDKILNFYKSQNWSLVKIEKKGKKPIEDEWQNTEHRDPKEWQQWLDEGYNIGLNLGLSGLTAIDFDTVEVYNELKDKFNNTLIQKTTNGNHYIYRNTDIPNSNLRPKHPIEIRGVGQQIVIEPSITDGFKRYFLKLQKPIEISEETKNFLLTEVKNKINKPDIKYELIPEGQRHYALMSIGGYFKNLGFNPKKIFYILSYINKNFTKFPKPIDEIKHICDSLYGYQLSEDEEAKREIMDYVEKSQEASKAEIEIVLFDKRVTGGKKKKLDSLLVQLIQEEKIYKDRKSYFIAEDAGWTDSLLEDNCKPIDFKMPYFYDAANFMWADLILISARTGTGKTHLALNICKKLIDQGIKPWLLETEPSKRFLKIAHQIGLTKNEFYYNKKVIDPESLKVEDNSINIIDWLDPNEWALTDKIFKRLAFQARKHNAMMIVFMQLRSNGAQFAKDLVSSFPSFCVNFLLEEDKIHGKFKVTKNNDPKYPMVWEIPTIFDTKTKILSRID